MRLLFAGISIFLFGLLQFSLTAQPASSLEDARMQGDLNAARGILRQQQPNLTPPQLERLAQEQARSNHLARSIEQALQRKDLVSAERFLKEFPGTVNDLRWSGWPPLLQAVTYGDEAAIELLLKFKADPNQAGPADLAPLSRAINNGRYAIARRLLAAGASATRTNRNGTAPLELLLTTPSSSDLIERQEFLDLLCKRGADGFAGTGPRPETSVVEDLLHRRIGWNVPMSLSVQPVAAFWPGDFMLTNSPTPATRTPSGDSALHLAAIWDRTNVLEFLLSNGFSADQTNRDGLTPLQSIAGTRLLDPSGMSFRVVAIPNSGPTPFRNVRLPPSGMAVNGGLGLVGPPLPQSFQSNLTGTATLLLEHGATLDVFSAAGLGLTNALTAMLATNRALVSQRDSLGRTPLHYAARNPSSAANGILLSNKADPSAITSRAFRGAFAQNRPAGSSPLHLAALAGNAVLIRDLLKAGANPALQDQDGNLALHLAARVYDTNCLGLLIQPSVLNLTNRDGDTPLLAALKAGIPSNVEFLLRAGSQPNAGLSTNAILHVAATRNRVIMDGLLNHGLKADMRDAAGRTPFEAAVVAKNWEVINLLLERGADINAADLQGNTALHLLQQDSYDTVNHRMDLPFWDRWKRDTLTGRSTLAQRTLKDLILRKWIAPAPNPVWTNSSLTAWLLKHGAKPNLANKKGETALEILCAQDWARYLDQQVTNRIATLLNAGARVETRNAQGVSPLHTGASRLGPQVLAQLLSAVRQPDSLRDPAGRTPLHWAAFGSLSNLQDSTARLLVFLTNRCSPNAVDTNGLSPLHAIAEPLHFSLLLTNGAQPNLRDNAGRTPLHHLLAAGNYVHPGGTTDEVLLTRGFDFGAQDRDGNTPLHYWMSNVDNSCSACGQLFNTIVTNRALLNVTNAGGDTLLHAAIRADRYYNAKTLIDAGANPAVRNREGVSALRLVAFNPGGTYEQIVRPTNVQNGFFHAITARDQNSFDRWLEADPSLCTLTNSAGQTPIMAACNLGLKDFAERLLSLGASLDLGSASYLGRMDEFRKLLAPVKGRISNTLLFEVARQRNSEALLALLEAGGDIHAADTDGRSMLAQARAFGLKDAAAWLESKGARQTVFDALSSGNVRLLSDLLKLDASAVNATNRLGRTPLMEAAYRTNREFVELLIERGARASLAAQDGMTALHFAASRNQVELGLLLLKAGAEPNAMTQHGIGPLHVAAAFGFPEFVELLLDHGADINLQPPVKIMASLGNSPLHWAAAFGHEGIVRSLLAKGADVQVVNLQIRTPAGAVADTARGFQMGFALPVASIPNRPFVMDNVKRAAMLKLLESQEAGPAQ